MIWGKYSLFEALNPVGSEFVNTLIVPRPASFQVTVPEE